MEKYLEKATEIMYFIVRDSLTTIYAEGPFSDPQTEGYYAELDKLADKSPVVRILRDRAADLECSLVNKYIYQNDLPTREDIKADVKSALTNTMVTKW